MSASLSFTEYLEAKMQERRKNVDLPDLSGVSKAQASEIIDSLGNGSYDPQKWSVPF